VLKDSKVDLVEVLAWCCNSATTALENYIQSFACESLLIADKPIYSRRPNEEAISV
jgi:hypothetical protein